MGESVSGKIHELDVEWVLLMLQAKELGLSVEEITAFLRTPRSEEDEIGQAILTGTAD